MLQKQALNKSFITYLGWSWRSNKFVKYQLEENVSTHRRVEAVVRRIALESKGPGSRLRAAVDTLYALDQI